MAKTTVGWREWLAFPDLGLPLIHAKVDTGATTSALHAVYIRELDEGRRVSFYVRPLQNTATVSVRCEAEVVEKRYVKSSTGHVQKRYVILTTMQLGKRSRKVELTLTNRNGMGFRMLLGREALRPYYVVDPARSHLTKRVKKEQLEAAYT